MAGTAVGGFQNYNRSNAANGALNTANVQLETANNTYKRKSGEYQTEIDDYNQKITKLQEKLKEANESLEQHRAVNPGGAYEGRQQALDYLNNYKSDYEHLPTELSQTTPEHLEFKKKYEAAKAAHEANEAAHLKKVKDWKNTYDGYLDKRNDLTKELSKSKDNLNWNERYLKDLTKEHNFNVGQINATIKDRSEYLNKLKRNRWLLGGGAAVAASGIALNNYIQNRKRRENDSNTTR